MRMLEDMAMDDTRIVFTGFVQGKLLEELYSNAYVYVLPSDLEGMPLTLLEAMSYGKCCVVSDIAECTEVTENKAVVFKKGNIEDLRDKLQMLSLDIGIVKRFANETIKFVRGKYSWDDIAEETLDLYRGKKENDAEKLVSLEYRRRMIN